MLKKIGIAVIIIASLGIAAQFTANSKKNNSGAHQKVTQTDNSNNSEAANTAEKFIKEYLNLDETRGDFDSWFSNAPVTKRFKTEFNERSHVLDISDRLLNQEINSSDLSSADKALLKKYQGIEYDALIGAIILDISDDSQFKTKSFDSKSGVIILKDTASSGVAEIKIKMVKENGNWLIDDILD